MIETLALIRDDAVAPHDGGEAPQQEHIPISEGIPAFMHASTPASSDA